MAQVIRVITGDPAYVASQIDTIANTEDIQIIEKTFSAGDYIVVSNNSAASGQTVTTVKGDPSTVASLAQALVGDVELICPTFSAGSYIVVVS